jgi:hypothetical protein
LRRLALISDATGTKNLSQRRKGRKEEIGASDSIELDGKINHGTEKRESRQDRVRSLIFFAPFAPLRETS